MDNENVLYIQDEILFYHKESQIFNVKCVVKGTELEDVLSEITKTQKDKDHTVTLHL